MIERRALGRTGLEVSVLGFGASELGGGWEPSATESAAAGLPIDARLGPDVPDSQAARLLNQLLDAGINFIDTSIDYGRSEELIGTHLAGRRSEFVLATKCGCVPGTLDIAPHEYTAANVRRGVENSLRTLRTDYLDVLFLHHPVSPQRLVADGALDALLALKAEGKARAIGISTHKPAITAHLDMDVFDVIQVLYNAVDRSREREMAAVSQAGIGIVVGQPIARGSAVDWRLSRAHDWAAFMHPQWRSIWEEARLDELLDGMSRLEFMLRFTLSNPDLDTAILGTSSPEHAGANAEIAARGLLPVAVLDEAKRRLDETDSHPDGGSMWDSRRFDDVPTGDQAEV